jgi:hypothetical protein
MAWFAAGRSACRAGCLAALRGFGAQRGVPGVCIAVSFENVKAGAGFRRCFRYCGPRNISRKSCCHPQFGATGNLAGDADQVKGLTGFLRPVPPRTTWKASPQVAPFSSLFAAYGEYPTVVRWDSRERCVVAHRFSPEPRGIPTCYVPRAEPRWNTTSGPGRRNIVAPFLKSTV